MHKRFELFAGGVISTLIFVGIASYGQGVSPSPSPSPTVCSALHCVNISIPLNAASMGSFSYGQNPLVISPGTLVTWINNDNIAHTVTADDNSFESGILEPGQTYSRLFDGSVMGMIPYHCSIHGAANMSGALDIVMASPTPSPSPTPSATPSPPNAQPGIAPPPGSGVPISPY